MVKKILIFLMFITIGDVLMACNNNDTSMQDLKVLFEIGRAHV